MEDIRMALMCGIDIPSSELTLTFHQPFITEIAYLGEKDYFEALQIICIEKNNIIQDKTVLLNTNNFQIFMTINEDKEKKKICQSLFQLIFPNYKIFFTPRSIMFQTDHGNVLVDETNFEILQYMIKQIFCWNTSNSQNNDFNPADAKAREIAEKIKRGRRRVAELKGETNASLFSQYLSVLTIGINSMSLQDLMNLTVYQLFDLYERYMTWQFLTL